MANANENGSVEPIENVSIFILNIADTFVVFYCTAALQVDKSIYIFFFFQKSIFFSCALQVILIKLQLSCVD